MEEAESNKISDTQTLISLEWKQAIFPIISIKREQFSMIDIFHIDIFLSI